MTSAALAASTLPVHPMTSLSHNSINSIETEYQFDRPNSNYHRQQWQTLNPGFWKIEKGALRRRLQNYGDRARRTGFPFHAETHKFKYDTDYDPFYWNFLEMEFDLSQQDPDIRFRIRNLVDSPDETPRGGGNLETSASRPGRTPTAKIPTIRVLPNADVHFYQTIGRPIRGTRSNDQGEIAITGLIDIPPGTKVIVNAFDGTRSESKVIQLVD